MLKSVHLSTCDKCDTVSLAPEYSPCPNCGKLMLAVKFIRVSDGLVAVIKLDADLSVTGLTKEDIDHAKI